MFLENISLDKMSNMKLLSLLTVAIVLIGIATVKALECDYERMSRNPNYATITTPKKVLSISRAYGICVAPNGNFAVMSYDGYKKIHIYYSCGKLMKVVDLSKHGLSLATDCAFTDRSLYVADHRGGKVYELSQIGKFIRIFATGHFIRMVACQDRLYITKYGSGQNLFVYHTNGRLIHRSSVPGNARGVRMGIDGNLYVSNLGNQVYTYTPEGKRVSVTSYKEVKNADGLAVDTAGHLLIADYYKGKLEVYSPCGALIKTIRTGGRYAVDVEIGNDGTILVASYADSKVFMF